MTQRVTDKELAEMISATGDWVTEIADAVAADLLDARAEIEQLRLTLMACNVAADGSSDTADDAPAQVAKCIMARDAEIAALKAKLGAVDVEDVRDVANAVFDIDQPCTDPETMCVICARRVGAARRLLAAVGEEAI